MRMLSAALSGLLFGLGLALSGMLDPARVLGFLDVAGAWDPSLAFVLGGAVLASACGYALSRRLRRPAFAERFDIPANRRIDGRLLLGAALFGIGWGLAGLCPGPALAVLPLGIGQGFVFVAAMLSGMGLFTALMRPRAATPARDAP